jgi:hypothetical protein
MNKWFLLFSGEHVLPSVGRHQSLTNTELVTDYASCNTSMEFVDRTHFYTFIKH